MKKTQKITPYPAIRIRGLDSYTFLWKPNLQAYIERLIEAVRLTNAIQFLKDG